MIQYEDIRELQQYPASPGQAVLSLYVNVDQSNAANLHRGFETAAEDELRHVAEQEAGTGDNLPGFHASRDRVIQFLKNYSPKAKSLVIFSDASGKFWWQRDLQVEVSTKARWSPQPWVRPLLDLMEERDRLLAVLVDNQAASIFSLDATGLHKEGELESDVPNRHQTTGSDHIWSQGQMERDREKHIKWHVKRAVEETGLAVDRLKIGSIVVGGPVEATTVFIDQLPKRLAQMVIETIAVPVDLPPDKLTARLRSAKKKADEENELRTVESLITAALKHDHAVAGLSDILEALHSGRVHRLIVGKNYRIEGEQCTRCWRLLATVTGEPAGQPVGCPFCGGDLQSAPDFVNRTTHKVFEQGGKVAIVSGLAEEKLKTVGSIGAILRF